MRRAVFLSMSLALVLGAASAAPAQVRLALKRDEGVSRVQETTKITQSISILGMEVKTNANVETMSTITVGRRMADGTVKYQDKMERMKALLELPGNMKLTFDSDKPEEAKNDSQALEGVLELYKWLAKNSFTYVADKDNRVVGVEDLDKTLATLPPAAGEQAKQEFNAESLKREANQVANALPDKPVVKGDKWMRTEVSNLGAGQSLTYETYYEYLGTVEKDGKTLDKIGIFIGSVKFGIAENSMLPAKVVRSDLKIDSTTGHLLFDRESGQIVERVSATRITGPMTLDVNGMQFEAALDLTLDQSRKQQK